MIAFMLVAARQHRLQKWLGQLLRGTAKLPGPACQTVKRTAWRAIALSQPATEAYPFSTSFMPLDPLIAVSDHHGTYLHGWSCAALCVVVLQTVGL